MNSLTLTEILEMSHTTKDNLVTPLILEYFSLQQCIGTKTANTYTRNTYAANNTCIQRDRFKYDTNKN
jgi:hypothetical protein